MPQVADVLLWMCCCWFGIIGIMWIAITGFRRRVTPGALTYGGGEEGDGFGLFAVVVDGQVPDARVHVLDEARVVRGDGHQAPLHGHGPLQTVDVLGQEPPPVQELHKVKLRTDARKSEED